MTKEETTKIVSEGANHRDFFNRREYYTDNTPVTDDAHWILQIIEGDGPLDREEPYKWYYCFREPGEIELGEFDTEDSFEYRLDRVYALEPDDDHRWCIEETNDFSDIDELHKFINDC